MVADLNYEPSIPSDTLQEIFKMSNGNVTVQCRRGMGGWERRLICEDCKKRIGVEGVLLLCKSEDEAFQKLLEFCASHCHNSHKGSNDMPIESTLTENKRRIKKD